MPYQLSLLDKCPLEASLTPEIALRNAVEAAQAADAAGFSRFWVAEHHDSTNYASSAPEVIVPYLLAKTEKIRIGTGGIMLQHYSPYKIAEIFNVLAALAPNRVDLGIGKAPGGLPASTQALQIEIAPESRLSFQEKAQALSQLLGGELSHNALFHGVSATPKPAYKAQGFLLGASVESAQFAAQLGWKMSYAGHLNGNEELLKKTFSTYQKATYGDTPQMALTAIVANTPQEAKARAAEVVVYKIAFPDRPTFTLPSYEAALEFAEQSQQQDYTIKKEPIQALAGTAASISEDLLALQQQYGIQEFMLELPDTSLNERISAIESLAYYQRQMAHRSF